jgi:transposase-like protein
MLKTEIDEHLGYEKHASDSSHNPNNRNGKMQKTIKSKYG